MTLARRRSARLATGVALAATVAVGGCATGSISTQQEVQLGRQYAAEINRQLPIVQDPTIHRYINQLGNSMARRVDRRGLDYTFYVVNSESVNAFAVPGGHIYINRGLIDRADNLAELAGVVAHEIGHVVERHTVEQIEKAQTANAVVGVLYGVLLGRPPSGVEQVGLQVGGSALFASYTRDAEREADRDAVVIMVRSGLDPRGLTSFFQELLNERKRSPGAVEQWFATHPTTEERIETVQQLIDELPSGSLNGLRMNTSGFDQFKARVAALPPAPKPRR